ncbi:separin protein [Coemansia sp. RSA 1358]|nr:separin protein [Coemansia sp. RSA 1358]
MQDKLLAKFQDFAKCDKTAEDQALACLATTTTGAKKPDRTEIEFALNLVNQTNKLFSKSAAEILAAFRFLHVQRSAAGFTVLALEKTISNFLTACANAHLGLLTWDGLVLLRELLLDHACAHIVVSANGGRKEPAGSRGNHRDAESKGTKTTAVSSQTARSVRKPVLRLNSSSTAVAEGISVGMRRLSINKMNADEKQISVLHFPVKYCQSDLAFNTLVVMLLCNMLRVLSQAPTSQRVQQFARELAIRSNSALDWCMRVREMDQDSVEPLLSACFRAYYALGTASKDYSLEIRLLGLVAYASTKACELRELLKYATKAGVSSGSAASADGTGNEADSTKENKRIAQFYSAILENIKPLLASTGITPEIVDFCYSFAQLRLKLGDINGSIGACQCVLLCAKQKGVDRDDNINMVSGMLVCNAAIHGMIYQDSLYSNISSITSKLAVLTETALRNDVRYTLAAWNSLALCADISRRTAKTVYAELRHAKSKALQDSVSEAIIVAQSAACKIYDAYIARGAASKAEGIGGTSMVTLLSHSSEASLVLIQIALQYQEHNELAQSLVCQNSDRILALCKDPRCNQDLLRSHSTVFFNRGANLYQLKIYMQAAQYIEHAIESLSQWISTTLDKKQPIGDAFAQLCKRYEVVASAYQSNGSFEMAAQTYGKAVGWIMSQFSRQFEEVIIVGNQGRVVLPAYSTKWNAVNEVERLVQFVDRYVRMCAGRLQKDATEHQAMLSLQVHVADVSAFGKILCGWLYELEAFYWRPYTTAPGNYVSTVREAHLGLALHVYEDLSPVGYARSLVEMAKIDRDNEDLEKCLDRLHAAMEIAKSLPENCVYSLAVIAECYAWQGVIGIERQTLDASNSILTSIKIWSLIERLTSGLQKDDKYSIDTGNFSEIVNTMNMVSDLLMSRRMYTLSANVQGVVLNLCMLCEQNDRTWAPTSMQCLIGLGTSHLLLGDFQEAVRYFKEAEIRYEPGTLPVHIEIASKIAYASFQLACGDSLGGAETMAQASSLARSSLITGAKNRSVLSKRNAASPETLVLFSKAAFAYSILALKQGALADSVDFGVHSYRILYSLLKSLSLSHKKALNNLAKRSRTAGIHNNNNNSSSMNVDGIDSEDDPFAMPKENTSDESDENEKQDKGDAGFLAFSGNWELQRLIIDSLAHLSEVYSIRGSVKEAEYFLNKGLEITARLNAPYQEGFMRLREADILSRKSLWDECASSLHKLRESITTITSSCDSPNTLDDLFVGRLNVVGALVTEGDAWRRSGLIEQSKKTYARAIEIINQMSDADIDTEMQTACAGSNEVTPRLKRIISQLGSLDRQDPFNANTNGDIDSSIPIPISILQEDVSIRQRLITILADLSNSTESQEKSVVETVGDSVIRSIDQKPEHLLMQANLAFVELKRMLESDPPFGMVLKSALVFPALQRTRAQKPRKGTLRAQIKFKLAELEMLLTLAVETAITIGSAHCVHSASHLLALVKAIAFVLGFGTSSGDHNSLNAVLARIIDGSKNITVVREALDASRRKSELISTQLTEWPSDVVVNSKDGQSKMDIDSNPSRMLNSSPVQSRLGTRKQQSFFSRGSLLSMMDEEDKLTGSANKPENQQLPASDYLRNASNGAKVVASWTTEGVDHMHSTLSEQLPSAWVVCGISIDRSSNMLFITRYQSQKDPIVACLPMRDIELDLGDFAADTNNEGHEPDAFDSAYRKLCTIIAASDQSMKTGKDCNTEAEKRKWWEQRASLDRHLGALLQNVQSEWLGGFHSLLKPTDSLWKTTEPDGISATAVLLRNEIQLCIYRQLPKPFAIKARAVELADQLCLIVLEVALRDASRESAASDDDGEHSSDWLDICAMLWDVHCYQGAAPQCDDSNIDDLASELKLAMRSFIETHKLNARYTKAEEDKQRHLILALDKHAQQIPWECLPCLCDYPISRIPSISFLQHRLATMNAKRNSSGEPLLSIESSIPSVKLAFSQKSEFQNMSSDSSRCHSPLLGPHGRSETVLSLGIPEMPSFSSLAGNNTRISKRQSHMTNDLPGVMVDGRRAFYVLNPEGDLHRTQDNFETFLCAQTEWRGVVGRRPMNHECEHGLSTSDVFMYFGHGGAESYISRSQIRSLNNCAVVLLLGCSSGQLKLAGEYDALGTAMDYIIGGCPALVGNLWDVGDKDIDRFAASMLQKWGLAALSPNEIAIKHDPEDGRSKEQANCIGKSDKNEAISLAEAVCQARKSCRMAFLTGAAPVVYGLPAYLHEA